MSYVAVLDNFGPYTFLSWIVLMHPEYSLPVSSKQIEALEVVPENVGLSSAFMSQVLHFSSAF